MAIPLTALGGVPIISVPRQPSSSKGEHTLINLVRLLDRLEAQLEEDKAADLGANDSWRTASLAIALTHANTALQTIQAEQGLSEDVSSLRARLQMATKRYVDVHPLQKATSKSTGNLRTLADGEGLRSFDTREYMLQGLMDDSDSDSEFELEQEAGAQHTAIVEKKGDEKTIGGVADETTLEEGEGQEFNEYETAASLRRRVGGNVKISSEKTTDDDGTEETSAAPTALQSERSVQDSLSSELLRMAGILKTNSIKFADALERDRKILEEADEKLQGNLSLITRTSGKLGEYSRKARSMGWLTLGAVAMVCMSWVVMFVLIRLT